MNDLAFHVVFRLEVRNLKCFDDSERLDHAASALLP